MPVRVFRGVCSQRRAAHDVTRLALPTGSVGLNDDNDHHIMVYATGLLLHVEQLSPALRHVLSIDLKNLSMSAGVTAVGVDPYGRIATALGNCIVVLRIDTDTARYEHIAEFDAMHHVNSLSWNGHSDEPLLLVGGETLTLWREATNSSVDIENNTNNDNEIQRSKATYMRVWQFKSVAESIQAKFSPDGNLFATLSHHDRRIKVWSRHARGISITTDSRAEKSVTSSEQLQYSFSYLVHPRAVTSFIWRHNSQFAISKDPPVLLTNCIDSVARIWAQSDNRLAHFVLVASIDAKTFPGTETCMPLNVPGQLSSIDHIENAAVLHWLEKDQLLATVNVTAQTRSLVKVGSYEKRPLPKLTNKSESLVSSLSLLLPDLSDFGTNENTAEPIESVQTARRRVLEMVQSYDDIVFTVLSDGAFLMWGIQRLFHTPRTIPKVLAMLRLAGSLLHADHPFFTVPVAVYHPPAAPHSPSLTSLDIELHMVGINPVTGTLRCYGINLADVFVNRPRAKIALRKEWNGHSDIVCAQSISESICRTVHPVGSHFVVTRREQEVIVWKLEGRNRGLRQSEGLVEVKRIAGLSEKEQVVSFGQASYFGLTKLQNENEYGTSIKVFKVSLNNQERESAVQEVGVLHSDNFRLSHTAISSWSPVINGEKSGESITHFRMFSVNPEKITITVTNFEANPAAGVNVSSVNHFDMRQNVPKLPDILLTTFFTLPLMIPSESVAITTSSVTTHDAVYIFATISSDKHMRLWACQSDSTSLDPVHWKVVSEVELLDPVNDIMSFIACSRKIAIVSEHRKIRIYNINILQNRIHLEHTLAAQDIITSFSLYPSITGLSFLAYSTLNSMHVLAPLPDTSGPASTLGLVWREVASPALLTQQKCRTTDTLSELTWVGSGDLIAFCGDMVIRADKWNVSPEEATTTSASCFAPHLFHLTHLYSTLPSYHPHLLVQYLLWGKFELTKYTLTQLYYYLRGTFGEIMSADTTTRRQVLIVPGIVGTRVDELLAEGAPHTSTTASTQQDTSLSSLSQFMTNVESGLNGSSSDTLDMNAYTQDKASYLTAILANIQLPLVSDLGRQQLIALTETVLRMESQRQALDGNGIRFMLFLQLFVNDSQAKSMTSESICWAFFSESQDVLIESCLTAYQGAPTWANAQSMGMGWWVHNAETLRKLIETVARSRYVSDERNPVSCSLLYLALRKKRLLQGLWKQATGHTEQTNMIRFLENDFTDVRWRKAALKNAFVLLGKQRYEYAAAFFLLGDSLKDAVSVCLKQLCDPQLAIVLCRLYEGDNSETMRNMLTTQLLSDAADKDNKYIAVMVLWLLHKREEALHTTLQGIPSLDQASSTLAPIREMSAVSPSLLILYKHMSQYLKKQHHTQYHAPESVENAAVSDVISFYEGRGCPLLAMAVLREWQHDQTTRDRTPAGSVRPAHQVKANPNASGLFDMDDWQQTSGATSSMNKSTLDNDFDQLFGTTVKVEDDLFGGDTTTSTKVQEEKKSEVESTPVISFTDQQLAWCRERILTRSLLGIVECAKAVGHNRHLFARELFFEDYQMRLREGFQLLCAALNVSTNAVQQLLVQFSVATHLTWHLVELQRCELIPGNNFSTQVSELLLDTTHAVSVLVVDSIRFGKGCSNVFFLTVANEILQSLYREKDIRSFDVLRIHVPGIVTAMSILSLYLIETRNYAGIALVVQHIDAIYESLYADQYQHIRTSLQPLVDALETVASPLDTGDDTNNDEGAVIVLQYLSLRRLLQPLKKFLQKYRSAMPDDTVQFIQHTWCVTALISVYKLQQQIIERITASMIQEFHEYIFDQDMLSLWGSLKLWCADAKIIENLLIRKDVTLSQVSEKAQLADASGTQNDETTSTPTHEYRREIVVQSGVPVWALGIDRSNPRFAALSFPRSIVEIDIERSWKFSKAMLKNKTDKDIVSTGETSVAHAIDIPGSPIGNEQRGVFTPSPSVSASLSRSLSQSQSHSTPSLHDALSASISPPSMLRRQTDALTVTLRRKSSTHQPPELQRLQSDDHSHTMLRHKPSIGSKSDHDSMASAPEGAYVLKRPGGSTWIESHPTLPYYFSSGNEQPQHPQLRLWQFRQHDQISCIPHTGGKINRIRFDPYGERYGVVDESGLLSMYRFSSTTNQSTSGTFFLLHCHARCANDLAFLDSSSIVATCGSSPGHINNVAIWDTLMPAHRALVKGFHMHKSGAMALAYDRQRQILYSAGQKGDLAAVDLRQRVCVKTVQAHAHQVHTLALDMQHNLLMSGSTDGNIKTFTEVGSLKQVHASKRFITPSLAQAPLTMHGITEISCSQYYAMTCGADGNVNLLKHET